MLPGVSLSWPKPHRPSKDYLSPEMVTNDWGHGEGVDYFMSFSGVSGAPFPGIWQAILVRGHSDGRPLSGNVVHVNDHIDRGSAVHCLKQKTWRFDGAHLFQPKRRKRAPTIHKRSLSRFEERTRERCRKLSARTWTCTVLPLADKLLGKKETSSRCFLRVLNLLALLRAPC